MTIKESQPSFYLSAIFLMGIILLTFTPAFQGTFIWDDTSLIAQNIYIKDFSYLKRNLTRDFWDVSFANEEVSRSQANVYYRPLVTLSFMLDYLVYGLRPWGFHLTNLLLHVIAVLLVFRLSQKLLLARPYAPWIVTLFFAIHPSRVEAVTWISGRADIMMAIFALLVLLLFHRALMEPRHRFWAFLFGWISYGLAILCKEAAVPLMLVIFCLDWLLISQGNGKRLWQHAKQLHLPLCFSTAVFLVARLIYQAHVLGPRPGLKLFERVTLVLQSIAHYTILIVNPYQPSMQIGAYYNPSSPSWPLALLGVSIMVCWLLAIIFAFRRSRIATFALIFFGACLAPVTNIFPLSIHVMVAERFLYFPFLGISLLAGLGLSVWLSPLPVSFTEAPLADGLSPSGAISHKETRLGPRKWLMIPVGLLLLSWCLTSNLRSRDFSDPWRFWRAEVASSPQNPLAEMNLAQVLVQQRRYPEAETWFLRSFIHWRRVVGDPEQPLRVLLRLVEVRLLRASDTEVSLLQEVAHFLSQLMEIVDQPSPREARAILSLGDTQLTLEVKTAPMRQALSRSRLPILSLLGSVKSRLGEDVAAEQALSQALAVHPGRMGTIMNLVLVRLRARNLEGAKELFSRAQGMAPDSPHVINLKKVIEQAGQRMQALSRAGYVGGTSTDPQVHWLLAEYYVITKAPMRVFYHLREVIRLAPSDRKARAMLALELAASGDLPSALRVVEEARKTFGSEPGLDALEQQVRTVRVTPSERSPEF